jgi:hypothetical protein
MRKRISLLIAALILALSMSLGGVAFAGQGGEPRTGSCGVGKAEADKNRAKQKEPGASEERLEPLGTCGTDVQS